ncbi:MAG TPA: hypothetical protein VFN97_25080 [Actinospica sp.]|nr:hypothetical protein [Actinospica sp.]
MNDSTVFPAELVAAYRKLARSREQGWRDTSPDAAWDYRTASREIRLHPFWRTLPGPAAVADAGRRLRALSVLPARDGGRPVVPYLPLELDPPNPGWTSALDPAGRARYAARLDAAGLWDRLPPDLRAQERRRVELTGAAPRHGLDYRDRQFFADGEELFERGAMHLLDELAPSLAELGLALDVAVLSDPYDPGSPAAGSDYVIEINGALCRVWTAQEGRGDAGWYLATVRPLIVVNELLEAVGARERLYVDGAGNDDGCAYLLPAEARAVLVDPGYGGWPASSLTLMERGLW